ncbi:hypothetical protein Clacol_002355 [Clathrus columnatus]|uniref:CNH domain-containing protein n=1 Tax=Clathrus columnatus TaxID=1419009 RepID=A0AAV5A0J7_9AGAM|nr:hypothetical protein Clacol_002355 [Clathrus columnatus]
MPPFKVHSTGLNGIKERVEAAFIQGDKTEITPIEIKKAFSRRAIEQLGYIKDTSSLVVLSDSLVTLFAFPDLKQATPLSQSRGALTFAINTCIQHISIDSPNASDNPSKGIPTVLTRLVIGCRKKVVVFSWLDGETTTPKELVLPHSPRTIAFVNSNIVCLSYTQTEQVMLSLDKMEIVEIELPITNPATNLGMGAFSGLGGYMTLGLGAKERKPAVVGLEKDEVLVPKDNTGQILGPNGKISRSPNIEWPTPPEENIFIKPYVLTILPPYVGTSKPGTTNAVSTQSSTIQITSTISLLPVQTLNPQSFETSESNVKPSTIRLLFSSQDKSPVYFFSTPIDRTAAAAEGTRLWKLCMQPWTEQIDELVRKSSYSEALALLESIDETLLPDKVNIHSTCISTICLNAFQDSRRKHIKALHAVWMFAEGKYDDAMNTFISLDTNPAKVVALYSDSVAGRLSAPKVQWFDLHGGPSPTGFVESFEPPSQQDTEANASLEDASAPPSITLPQSPTIRNLWRVSRGGPLVSVRKEDDNASIMSSKTREKHESDDLRRSIECLVRFLTDRRPKISGVLSTLNITPAQASEYPSLSSVSVEELLELPNLPLSSLTPDQLLRSAQIVDTALFKSYLVIRRFSLLGSLCRLPNWCDVSEVEQVLKSNGVGSSMLVGALSHVIYAFPSLSQKLTELIDLYNGKKMHDKALTLLREMSADEDDKTDKLGPTISYLQKLGPEYISQIFESSHWVLETDPDMAFDIFTSEETQLPHTKVADYLEDFDPYICIRYLEFLIYEKHDASIEFHERLAESYLKLSLKEKSQNKTGLADEMYSKLVRFIDESQHIQVDRLFGLLPSDDMFEVRAILLGQLGKHEGALEIYVHRLQDYIKAEEYCKRIYHSNAEMKGVFLILLRIYLRAGSVKLLQPALGLISRHGPRLDSIETLNLLPPMIPAQDLKAFLKDALREPIFDTRVVREIWNNRDHQISSALVGLQARRVKITDSRICPQCHKRIGNSVIAVHAPRASDF